MITTLMIALTALTGYHVQSTIPGPDGGWDLASVDPSGRRLFVARGDSVTVANLSTNRSRQFATAQRGHAALAVPGTNLLLVTNGSADSATLFDRSSGALMGTLPTGKKPDAATYDPATRTVWVMNAGSGDITIVGSLTRKVVGTLMVGGSLELGAADGTGRLYVNIEDRNSVAVIDTRSRKLVKMFPLAGCDGPTGIAYAASARQLISACANGVAIVSRPDGTNVASLPIGKGADGAVFDAKRGVALIPAGRDANLSVIQLGSRPHVVKVLPTARGARTIALDEHSGRVYLAAADQKEAEGDKSPQAVPGTWRVIVIAP